jgi:hypothetical protein
MVNNKKNEKTRKNIIVDVFFALLLLSFYGLSCVGVWYALYGNQLYFILAFFLLMAFFSNIFALFIAYLTKRHI